MSVLKSLKSKFARIAIEAAEKRIDGSEIAKDFEKSLDGNLTEKESEKIQRGPITGLLMEMLIGFWHEDRIGLAEYLEEAAKGIRGGNGHF